MRVIFHLFIHNWLLLSIGEEPLHDGIRKKKEIRVKFHTRRALPVHSWGCQKSKNAERSSTAIYRARTKGHHTDQPATASPDDKNRHVGDKNNYFKHTFMNP